MRDFEGLNGLRAGNIVACASGFVEDKLFENAWYRFDRCLGKLGIMAGDDRGVVCSYQLGDGTF